MDNNDNITNYEEIEISKKIQRLKEFIKNHLIVVTVILLIFLGLRTIAKVYEFKIKFKDNISMNMQALVVDKLKEDNDKKTYKIKYNGSTFLLYIYRRDEIDEVYFKKSFEFKYADVIKFNGKISNITKLGNEGEFDYKMYLNSNNIAGQITTSNAKKIKEKNGNVLIKLTNYIKNELDKKLDKYFNEASKELFKSMIYGDKTNLSDDIKEGFRENGISHIIVVSGTNLSFIIIILTSIISLNKDKKKSDFFICLILVFFLCMSSFSVSILRATIMFFVSNFFKKIKCKTSKFTPFFISLFLIISINPYYIFNISFILSFIAVLSIILFSDMIKSGLRVIVCRILNYKSYKVESVDNSKFKLKKSIYKISTCITDILSQFISVQVLVFPIQIYYFSSFELLSPISNVLLYPLIYISFLFGFISLFLFLVPVISPLILTSTNLIFSFVIFITQKLAYLNISITIPRPRIWMIVLYYILVFLFLNDKKAIRYFKLNVAKNVRAIKYILTCVFVVLVSIYYTYVMFFEKYIYYFNVGQGNMALIHYNKKNILLDCGSTSNNVTYNLLSGFMKLKGIKNIDILVISHFHEDHMNLITSDKMDIQIDKIIYAKPKEEIETYDLVLNYAQKNNISFIETSIFEEYNYDNISMQIISPSSNTKIEDQDVQNANSVVTLITINNKNMLFMGDSTINTEEYIMQKIENMENTQDKENVLKKLNSIDIYQVGHHGSISSTSQKWLDYLNIKNAVISSKKQVYGHPSDEVLKRLMDKNITVYVTEKDKAIKFKL